MRPRLVGNENIVVAVLGLAFGVVFFDRNALGLLVPFIRADIPLTNTQIGMLASALSFTWAVSGFVFGLLSDRLGLRKGLLIVAVIAFSLAAFLSGLAQSFVALLGARSLMGLAEGPILPISQCLMKQASSPRRRGLNMGLMQTVLSSLIGGFAAPLLIVAVAGAVGWRSAFFITSVPGLAAAGLIYWLVPTETPIVRIGAPEASHIGSVLASGNIWVCAFISAMMVGWLIVGWAFLPVYLTSETHLSVRHASFLLSMTGFSTAIAGVLLPALSDRFGRRPIMILGCLLGAVVPLSVLFGSGSLALMSLLFATGWLAGGVFSLFMATIPSESTPTGSITTAMALIMGVGELFGGTAAPTLVGHFVDRFGPAIAPAAQLVFAVLAALMALRLTETAPCRNRAPAQDPVLA